MSSANRLLEKTLTLETERLILRIPDLKDVPHIFSATRHKGFNDGMLWNPPDYEQEIVEAYHRSIQAWEAGEGYAFSIDDKRTGDFLGRISIRKTKKPDVWNTGFWTHPVHQGKGVMKEALATILKLSFGRLGAKKVEACYATWNIASEKVMQSNGMQYDGFIEKGFKKNGKWVAENLMSVELKDWKGADETESKR